MIFAKETGKGLDKIPKQTAGGGAFGVFGRILPVLLQKFSVLFKKMSPNSAAGNRLLLRRAFAGFHLTGKDGAYIMCKRNSIGGCCAAFGAGLLVATLLPSNMILFLLAAALVVLGCVSCKR